MQILVATLRGAVHQQQRAAAYTALLPSLSCSSTNFHHFDRRGANRRLAQIIGAVFLNFPMQTSSTGNKGNLHRLAIREDRYPMQQHSAACNRIYSVDACCSAVKRESTKPSLAYISLCVIAKSEIAELSR